MTPPPRPLHGALVADSASKLYHPFPLLGSIEAVRATLLSHAVVQSIPLACHGPVCTRPPLRSEHAPCRVPCCLHPSVDLDIELTQKANQAAQPLDGLYSVISIPSYSITRLGKRAVSARGTNPPNRIRRLLTVASTLSIRGSLSVRARCHHSSVVSPRRCRGELGDDKCAAGCWSRPE